MTPTTEEKGGGPTIRESSRSPAGRPVGSATTSKKLPSTADSLSERKRLSSQVVAPQTGVLGKWPPEPTPTAGLSGSAQVGKLGGPTGKLPVWPPPRAAAQGHGAKPAPQQIQAADRAQAPSHREAGAKPVTQSSRQNPSKASDGARGRPSAASPQQNSQALMVARKLPVSVLKGSEGPGTEQGGDARADSKQPGFRKALTVQLDRRELVPSGEEVDDESEEMLPGSSRPMRRALTLQEGQLNARVCMDAVFSFVATRSRARSASLSSNIVRNPLTAAAEAAGTVDVVAEWPDSQGTSIAFTANAEAAMMMAASESGMTGAVMASTQASAVQVESAESKVPIKGPGGERFETEPQLISVILGGKEQQHAKRRSSQVPFSSVSSAAKRGGGSAGAVKRNVMEAAMAECGSMVQQMQSNAGPGAHAEVMGNIRPVDQKDVQQAVREVKGMPSRARVSAGVNPQHARPALSSTGARGAATFAEAFASGGAAHQLGQPVETGAVAVQSSSGSAQTGHAAVDWLRWLKETQSSSSENASGRSAAKVPDGTKRGRSVNISDGSTVPSKDLVGRSAYVLDKTRGRADDRTAGAQEVVVAASKGKLGRQLGGPGDRAAAEPGTRSSLGRVRDHEITTHMI